MSTGKPITSDERVLLFMPEGRGPARIQAMLNRAGFDCQACAAMDELCSALEQGAGAAVLTMELLTAPAMKHLVEALDRQPSWSDFPVVILIEKREGSAKADLRMLDLLEPLGNATVLQRPVTAIGLVSAVRAGLRSRRRQYQVRDLLDQGNRAIRHRDTFLSLLAHELRNPLSAIRNATHILERLGPQTNQAVEQLSLIERQTTRLASLIDEVLDVYQVLAGKVALKREPIDLAALAGRCLATVAAEAEGQRHQLVLTEGGEKVKVQGDPQRLEQVILHLLTNAIRYTSPRGRIDVSVTRETDTAVLRVRDSGIGLSPEALPGLFDQFSVADNPLRRPPEGGLRMGLTLVRGLVQLHGGSVSASSAGLDQGSEFVVRLPLLRASAEPISEAAPSAEPVAGPRRVLVIEDNADGRESLRLMLQLWGHEVEAAGDGPQGVQKAHAWRPDVVLLDIGLPGEDGYQVARRLREALGASVYLIAMTGYGRPHDRQLALEAGFDTYLVKPVVLPVLQELLAGPPTRPERREEKAVS